MHLLTNHEKQGLIFFCNEFCTLTSPYSLDLNLIEHVWNYEGGRH
jgi:hypothetical protein